MQQMEQNWQAELAESITDISEMCRILDLPDSLAEQGAAAHSEWPLLVPRKFVQCMERGNPDDPLLLQIIPQSLETKMVPLFVPNPLSESPEKDGILQKYPGRALFFASSACGVHCRFCFRRHSLRSICPISTLGQQFDLLESSPNIEEVILSGGDPLCEDDDQLDQLLHYIEKCTHVKRIRIHSRLPVVLPSRITEKLATCLKRTIPCFLVFHINHPSELQPDFISRLYLLRETPLFSQTVLLRGVNDSLETLLQLMNQLVNYRIFPYYLHQLDRVAGSAHFEVSIAKGRKLVSQLRRRLPGYAVPKYVQEVVSFPCKKPLE
ncbi:MAG: KamA family radical SAM protein [Thermoguttaceae bacterium]